MRKNKTWNLNLFDEDVLRSVEQIENAVFYTSDTEAFLNFIPQDSGFEFDSATIALFNNDDQSLVSTSMVVTDGKAQYEIPPNVISHFGNWSAQVIFAKQSENYTSRLINFEVERYLMDERPPRLEDVESIGLLVAEAREIIQELEAGLASLDTAKYDNHIANKANPHAVTKSQVGLGSVQNYGIATQAEAEVGTSNIKYMTPLQVKNAIKELTKPFETLLGNGSSKQFTLTHNLNRTAVVVDCYINNEKWQVDTTILDANRVRLDFYNYTPATNSLRVVII